MTFDEMIDKARDALTVRKVYGDPVERDGVTLIPAAAVRGGVGGGGGEDPTGAKGSGGGFGMSARPVGAYQIKNGEVTWLPALDQTRVIVLGQVAGILALLTLRALVRRIGRKR